MTFFVLTFNKASYYIFILDQSPIAGDVHQNVSKCCRLEESLEIVNNETRCVENYDHYGFWMSFNVNVAMKRGNILSESKDIALNIVENGVLQVFNGTQTDFYEKFCIDHIKDVLTTIIHEDKATSHNLNLFYELVAIFIILILISTLVWKLKEYCKNITIISKILVKIDEKIISKNTNLDRKLPVCCSEKLILN